MLTSIKLWIVSGLAGLLAFGGVGAALAQGETPPADRPQPEPGVHWGGGEVVAVEADSFTIRGPRGEERELLVTGATVFYNEQAEPAGLADVQVGDHVRGAAHYAEDGTITARLVVVFPPPTEYKGVGLILSLEEDEFTFRARRGKVWEFYVDEATQIADRQGNALSLADLRDGQGAFVQAELRDDGEWWATEIKVLRARP